MTPWISPALFRYQAIIPFVFSSQGNDVACLAEFSIISLGIPYRKTNVKIEKDPSGGTEC